MLAYENIPYHAWEADFIKDKIQEICQNIGKKGERTLYNEAFDLLYEYIEDNINKFLPEVDYE